jgi:hypothetical protein
MSEINLEIFDGMTDAKKRQYLEFLLWHYRVVDAFWYIYVSEKYGSATADGFNEQVWGRVARWRQKTLSNASTLLRRGLWDLSKP